MADDVRIDVNFLISGKGGTPFKQQKKNTKQNNRKRNILARHDECWSCCHLSYCNPDNCRRIQDRERQKKCRKKKSLR
jgi:hypothetical protein